jgi:hypothetical protein
VCRNADKNAHKSANCGPSECRGKYGTNKVIGMQAMTKMNVYIFAPGANMITRVQFAGVGERDGAKKKMSFVHGEEGGKSTVLTIWNALLEMGNYKHESEIYFITMHFISSLDCCQRALSLIREF